MFESLKKLFKKKDDNKLSNNIENEKTDQDEQNVVNEGLNIEETENWCSASVYCHMFSKDPDQ